MDKVRERFWCSFVQEKTGEDDTLLQWQRGFFQIQQMGWFIFFWKLVYTFDRLKKSAARKMLTESQPPMACGQGSAFADLSLTAPRSVGAGRHPA